MKLKTIIVVMVVMLACGCTDELTGDLDLSGEEPSIVIKMHISEDRIVTQNQSPEILIYYENQNCMVYCSFYDDLLGHWKNNFYRKRIKCGDYRTDFCFNEYMKDTSMELFFEEPYTTAPPPSCANSTTIQTEDIVPTHFIQNWMAHNITPTKHVGSNWTMIDDNIRGIIIDYHFDDKQWKYITIDGATCKQIDCEFEGGYCLECEEINESD